MRKLVLILILVSGLAFVGFAENTKEQAPVQKNSFRLDADLFWTLFSTVVVQPDNWKCGLSLFGADITVFKWGKWNFLGVGGGIALHLKKNPSWYYNPYSYYGWEYKEYDAIFWPYLKIVPVKYHWGWLSKFLKTNSHLEISIGINPFKAEKDVMIIVGLSFSDLFKKKKRAEEKNE